MRILWIAALAAAAHAALIRGVVVENQSGKPLLRTIVSLKPLPGTIAPPQAVRTNASGIFEFAPVPGGAYLVSAARRNFYSVQYGQKDWRSAGAPVIVEETASTFLQIRLPKLGVITGRVVDENDVGLPNQSVVAYRNTHPPQLVSRVTSDERGVYRFFDLEPGAYLVKTVANESDGAAYVPTFSKDTLKVEDARAVDVMLDREEDRIDVAPFPGKLFKIAGRVFPGAMVQGGPDAGSPVTVKLTFASDMGREVSNTNGAFRFPPVAPGDYELYAEGPGDGTVGCPMVGGYLPLRIRDKDRTDIDFVVPCVRDGTIQLVESKGMPVEFSKARIYARRKDMAGARESEELQVGTYGRGYGRLRLPPGRWELMAIPAPGYCVVEFGYRRSRSEGVDPPRPDGWNEVLIDNHLNTLRFVLSSSPGTLRGLVSGLSREPVAGAPVFLEGYDPDNRKRVTEVRVVNADPRGYYRFPDLSPGKYRVLSTFEFQNPDAAAMEFAGARVISIEEGKDTVQDLDLSVIR